MINKKLINHLYALPVIFLLSGIVTDYAFAIQWRCSQCDSVNSGTYCNHCGSTVRAPDPSFPPANQQGNPGTGVLVTSGASASEGTALVRPAGSSPQSFIDFLVARFTPHPYWENPPRRTM